MLVLIDTWWNVNKHYPNASILEARFNRYMVECELTFYLISFFYIFVLIDTWWNVNVTKSSTF